MALLPPHVAGEIPYLGRTKMSSEPNQLTIEVNSDIHLTPIRQGDKAAFVRFLNDKNIYDHTLRIPYPYSKEDADSFLAIVSEATAKHGHPVHFAIRSAAGAIHSAGGAIRNDEEPSAGV